MTSERKPEQIIGHDAYMQLVFEGYAVIRAVPDVPELVRYERTVAYEQQEHLGMVEHRYGDYVLHSQAAEIIAAKDREIERLKEALQEIANSYTAHGYNDAVDAVVNLQYIAKDCLNAKR